MSRTLATFDSQKHKDPVNFSRLGAVGLSPRDVTKTLKRPLTPPISHPLSSILLSSLSFSLMTMSWSRISASRMVCRSAFSSRRASLLLMYSCSSSISSSVFSSCTLLLSKASFECDGRRPETRAEEWMSLVYTYIRSLMERDWDLFIQ